MTGQGERHRLERRTLLVLAVVQVFGAVAFFLGIAVIALLGREVSGSDALSGLPVALGVLASALAAPPVSAWMTRAGRRPGLAAGHLCAAAGSAVVVVASGLGSFPLLCLGTTAFGVGNTSNLLARYAGADLSPPERRARAIGTVLLATAVGAVIGPTAAGAAAPLGAVIGVPELAAPFAVSAVGFLIAAALVVVLLRPDPLLVARDLGGGPSASGPASTDVPPRAWPPLALVALASLVTINAAMIGIMTMTPLHLENGGQTLAVVGVVFSMHVGAMFLPSPITGWLTDRLGRLPLIAASGAGLAGAGALAALSSGHQAALIAAALVVLGLAWNAGLVSGSALLTDAVPVAVRARAQGRADLAMGVAGAVAGFGSGLLVEAGGFPLLAMVGATLGAGLLVLAARGRRLALQPG